MLEIEGKPFTLFWDMDRGALASLSFDGRTKWLHARINEVLLKPLSRLEDVYSEDLFVWLVITDLVCAGIEAMGGFFGNRKHGPGTNFCRFVSRFMHCDFTEKTASNEVGQDVSYCNHLQTYFRGGLAHGFKIEWGGLWMANDPICPEKGYLRRAPDGKGIAVCPRMLLDDFRQALAAYFQRLADEGENSTIGQNFAERFEAIREHRSQRGR